MTKIYQRGFEKSLHNFKENIYKLRQKHVQKVSLQLKENQLVIKYCKKRCLIRLQKGVNKGLKGHLLHVNWALIASHFMLF